MKKVGFIGLGLMGKPMARNLIKAGFELTVYSRSRRDVDLLAADGAKPASNPKEVAENSEVVIIMVPDSGDVEGVVLSKTGLVEGIRPGSVVVDMGTISPRVEVKLAQLLKAKDVEYLDAPVTGGDVGAAKGTLTIMVGGNEQTYARCLPVLKAMGTNVFHMGPTGAGQLTKICNQIIVSLNLLATGEGLMFAKKAGLDPSKVIEVLGGGAAASWQLVNFGPKMLRNDFEPGFKVSHLQKDLRIALSLADELKLPMLGISTVHQLLHSTEQEGQGGKGTPILISALEKLSGFAVNK
jgi:3-hydroxyisobutyrate dehydrogenase